MAGYGSTSYGESTYGGEIVDETLLVVVLGQASETDTALPLRAVLRGTLGLATETDTAASLTVVASNAFILGAAIETDTALPLTALYIGTLGPADETDEAQPLDVVERVRMVLGQAHETDTALPFEVGLPTTITLGPAEELDEALPVGLLVSSPYVLITHTYLRGDGTPAEGAVTFMPRFASAEGVTPPTISYTNQKVSRLVDGTFEIRLLEGNPLNTNPGVWTYRVIEEIDNLLLDYDAYVDFAPLIVDLRDLVPVGPDDGVP